VAICIALVVGLGSGSVQALPPDPQRAFDAATCEEARVRHAEALAGSPLISQEENAEVLVLAEAQLARLCDPGPDNYRKRVTQSPNIPVSSGTVQEP
jgi:hypothetical protein